MEILGQRLQSTLRGRVCVMGVGNVDYGDDGFGVYLAEELVAAGLADVIIAGTTPEHYLGRIAEQGFDHLLVVDATNFGDEPGTVVFLNAAEIETAFPQVSTHKISLGVLARVLEQTGTKVWLLGVQPESLEPGQELSRTMQASLEIVHCLLRDVRTCQTPPQMWRDQMEKAMA
ncbi:MAG TPA: hydrogenase 3 maturation endopeptidase HyCI [Terriglobales bacterium]|nr:hydrogenase 3 maturation endopeptidase HyCI [Terriglobales bacterium]